MGGACDRRPYYRSSYLDWNEVGEQIFGLTRFREDPIVPRHQHIARSSIPAPLWHRLLRRSASEYGRLCRGDGSHEGGMPVTAKKAKGRTANTGSDPAQASVTEIVTHVAQHDAISRNRALLRPCAFDIATS